MAGMLEYIHWRGDLTFSQQRPGLIDMMILCELSYLNMSKAFDERETLCFSDAVSIIQKTEELSVKMLGDTAQAMDIVLAAADSRRFGKLRICAYRDVLVNCKLNM